MLMLMFQKPFFPEGTNIHWGDVKHAILDAESKVKQY